MGLCHSCLPCLFRPKKVVQHDGVQIIFKGAAPPVTQYTLPRPDKHFTTTPQLAYCLSLIQHSSVSGNSLGGAEREWIQRILDDNDEQGRLRAMPSRLIEAFIRNVLKKQDIVAEIVSLAAVLEKDDFRELLQVFVDGIDKSVLQVHFLDGLSQLIRNASQEYINSDDLVNILGLLHRRLVNTHMQSTEHTYRLAFTISNVLDSMVDSQVKGISSEQLTTPLNDYLGELQKSSDAYLVYQAAYTSQALIYINDDYSVLTTALQRTGKVVQGVSGVVSAVTSLDLNEIIKGLDNIQKGLKGAEDLAMLATNTYANAKKLTESGQGLFKTLKDCFKQKSAWYPALRVLDRSILECQFAGFEELVRRTPCRKDPAFQWGLCQRLGGIAVNNAWSAEIRKCANNFLGELYKDDRTWGQHANIKQCIIYILSQLVTLSDDDAAVHAKTLLEELKADGSTEKQALYQLCVNYSGTPHPIIFFQPPKEYLLLNHVQNKTDIEAPLLLLKSRRLKDPVEDVYVPLNGKSSPIATDDFDLMSRAEDFLKNDGKVFLLLGDSGAGKSTFSRILEIYLWKKYVSEDNRVPLFIHLPLIEKPEHDLIAKQLHRLGFDQDEIKELKGYRKFILICDGYDEIQQTRNLYDTNQFNKPGEWQVQMVISCRTEYIGVDYKNQFQPTDGDSGEDIRRFEEAIITPLNTNQIQDYVMKYVSSGKSWDSSLKTPQNAPLETSQGVLLGEQQGMSSEIPQSATFEKQQDMTSKDKVWGFKEYKQALESIPDIYDLVKNPFLLDLALKTLPGLFDKKSTSSAASITRIEIYDKFVSQWFERSKEQLGGRKLSSRDREFFWSLCRSGFASCSISYMKEFATAIYDHQGGKPIVSYLEYQNQEDWKKALFSNDNGRKLLSEAIPLTHNAGQYQFIHKSILEYGLSLAVWDPNEVHEDVQPIPITSPLLRSPLGRISFIRHPSILEFLAERAQQQPVFKNQLRAVIKLSKVDENAKVAAANAIEILVQVGIQYKRAGLQGIKVLGTDSSYGVSGSAYLEEKEAQTTGTEVRSCVFSPSGKIFAVGLSNNDINLYETSSWVKIRSLKGHGDSVNGFAFLSEDDRIVSGSDDETVRLWDVDTGSCIQTSKTHGDLVKSVAYSPKRDQIACGSYDKTVRLLGIGTLDCIRILQGHSDKVRSVAYSPEGDQIASGSDDNTVKLWNVDTGNCIKNLKGHNGKVSSVAYSPKGDRIASGSWDRTVRLWNINTRECIKILWGHSDSVTSVAYSPKGDQIVSGSWDQTVRLWNINTGKCIFILGDHSDWVQSVTYSPDGDQVASGSWDRTVRLWNINTGKCVQILKSYIDHVNRNACSPEGNEAASRNEEGAVEQKCEDVGYSLST